MSDAVARDRKRKREALLNDADEIVLVLRACGAKSEELGTLLPDAVTALRTLWMFNLEHCTQSGGSEAEPVTEMMVLEQPACEDLTGPRCTRVGVTAIATLGTFLPQSGLEKVFTDANVPTVAISFVRPDGERMSSAACCATSTSVTFTR